MKKLFVFIGVYSLTFFVTASLNAQSSRGTEPTLRGDYWGNAKPVLNQYPDPYPLLRLEPSVNQGNDFHINPRPYLHNGYPMPAIRDVDPGIIFDFKYRIPVPLDPVGVFYYENKNYEAFDLKFIWPNYDHRILPQLGADPLMNRMLFRSNEKLDIPEINNFHIR